MRDSSSERERICGIVAREHERLYAVADEDPAQAIAEARQLNASPDLNEINLNGLRASIFIDAGGRISDAAIVLEGVELLRRINRADTPDYAYNIGNGLATLAQIQRDGSPGQIGTVELRQEARCLFQHAAEHCDDPSVRSAAFTNQANLLKDSFRWVEAYDAYAAALEHDPTNAIALSGISSLLQWRLRRRVEAEGPLRRAAVRYLLRARGCLDQAHRYAGQAGVGRVEELVRQFKIDVDARPEPEPPPASPYASFVRGHRLALCLAPESAGAHLGRWDHLAIKSVIAPLDNDNRVPTIFASWNALKSDFLTARWLAYAAINGELPETGFYSDTLDYANYGSHQSALVLAHKAALDVLDKIAVASTDYLTLKGDPQHVYFGTRWHVLESKHSRRFATPLRWQPEIEAEIATGNRSLIALAELAHDYANGYLRSKKQIRNSATHGLVILHDMPMDGQSRPSAAIERYGQREFERLVIASLQLVRATLLYFHEMVSARERRLEQGSRGFVARMTVPSRHGPT
jgi:hypothetical protein